MAADSGRRALDVLLIAGLSALALLGAAFVLWIWALSTSNGSPPPAEGALLAMPESSLVYPNATHVEKVGQGTECRGGVWEPAGIEFTFTTVDSAHDLFVWYSEQLKTLGWSAPIPDAGATGYSLTRDSDELFEIDVSLNIDGTPYRVGNEGTQFTTDFQHTFKSGHC